MKARLEENGLKFYPAMPKFYTTATVTYAGDFDKQPDSVHEAEGFYPVIYPTINPKLQKVGDLYFDATNKVFTYQIVDRVINLDSEKQRLLNDLDVLSDEIMMLNQKAEFNHPEMPQELIDLQDQTRGLYFFAKAEIEALATPEDAVNYVLRGPQVAALIESYKSFTV